MLSGAAFVFFAGPVSAAHALSLREAVSVALDSNPEIGQAIENREAIEFELRQARALYHPRVDAEASTGLRELDSPDRRATGLDDHTLHPRDAGITATWKLFDGFERDAEVERQASRVDGASHRVYERSEFIALSIAKEYVEILLQGRILAISEENLRFHRSIRSRISQGVEGGTLTDADRQQADERLKAAEARIVEARDELEQARIRFFKFVGQPATGLDGYPNLSSFVPASIDDALGHARSSNPRVQLAQADIDAASALVKQARSRYFPQVSLEGSARTGDDIDGTEDRTTDLQGRIVTKWNLWAGGGDIANEQEQIRRLSEERMRLHSILREIDEAVSSSWTTRSRQSELARTLSGQAAAGRQVVASYDDQFQAGKRTLLDLLSAQNTYYNARVVSETAKAASDFANYRILAAMGNLVASLGLSPPAAAEPYARAQARVPETPEAETMRRYSPDRGERHDWGWGTTVVKE